MRPVRLVLVALAVAPLSARGQAVTDPNQIVGSLRISSANPEVLAVITTPSLSGAYAWNERADSVDLASPLVHWSSQPGLTRESTEFELTVESSAAGISYDVRPQVSRPGGASALYVFASQRTAPVLREPAPDVRVDVAECAGLFRVAWTDESGAPLPVQWARASAFREDPPGSGMFDAVQARNQASRDGTSLDLLARGDGSLYRIVVDFTVGLDPFHDTVTTRQTFERRLDCDAIVDIPCGAGAGAGSGGDSGGTGGGAGGACPLGRVTGRIDLRGVEELLLRLAGVYTYWTTSVGVRGGPFGNERWDVLDREPSSGDFELENLVPSTATDPPTRYQLEARLGLRTLHGYEDLFMPRQYVQVGCGETVDLPTELVGEPRWVRGAVRLEGPPALPASGAVLADLERASDPEHDADADGIPDLGSEALRELSCIAADGGGEARADFAGTVDATAGTFLGDYDLVLHGRAGLPSSWNVPRLRLRLNDAATPGIPMTYQDSLVVASDGSPGGPTWTSVDAGAALDRDVEYCFSQVDLAFLSTTGTFFAPRIDPDYHDGIFDGIDSFGIPRRYVVSVDAAGTPLDAAHAAASGLVVMALPEGEYDLQPRVTSVNPGGGTSETQLPMVHVRAGCREVIDLFPDFALEVGAMPPCAEAGVVTVAGQVTGSADIARITATVNGSEREVCTGCGVAPTFAADVSLDTDSTVVFTAVAADGRVASRTAFTRIAAEPSAGDRRPGSAPLLVTRDGAGGLRLRWEDQPGRDANAYAGTIASLRVGRHYDHAGMGACGLAGGIAAIPMPSGDAYFLVASTCGWADSSLGRDSFGRERPAALDRCR